MTNPCGILTTYKSLWSTDKCGVMTNPCGVHTNPCGEHTIYVGYRQSLWSTYNVHQMVDNVLDTFVHCVLACLQCDLGVIGWLVYLVHSGESYNVQGLMYSTEGLTKGAESNTIITPNNLSISFKEYIPDLWFLQLWPSCRGPWHLVPHKSQWGCPQNTPQTSVPLLHGAPELSHDPTKIRTLL